MRERCDQNRAFWKYFDLYRCKDWLWSFDSINPCIGRNGKGLNDNELYGVNDSEKLKENWSDGGKSILVPALILIDPDKLQRCVRVFESSITDHQSNSEHPDPDPLLLDSKPSECIWPHERSEVSFDQRKFPILLVARNVLKKRRHISSKWHQNSLKKIKWGSYSWSRRALLVQNLTLLNHYYLAISIVCRYQWHSHNKSTIFLQRSFKYKHNFICDT